MAYTHSKYEVIAARGADLAATGDEGDWAPGYIPHIIRAVVILITNTIGATGTISVDKRVTFGSDSGRLVGHVATIALTTAHVGGVAIYKDGLDVEILPGEQVMFDVTDAAASGDLADLILYVEPRWETPANISAMVAA